MNPKAKNINKELDQLFRNAYAKILSTLLSKYGISNFELCENAIMEAYYKALKTWPFKQKPQKPIAWLIRVANNSLIDQLRRNQKSTSLESVTFKESTDSNLTSDESEIKDPELKLLFLICNPSLKKEDQLAFMLKTLSGFGDEEIANALMQNKSTIKKRLLRARNFIKDNKISFTWPSPDALVDRLEMVHRALYLLFNEGFYTTHPQYGMRKELCIEAMRLCKYLADHALVNAETNALMALFCFHTSRFESRLDGDGNIVLLHEQDRSLWDPKLIKVGDFYMQKSALDKRDISRYQIEAFISAIHCQAKSIETTNWNLLKEMHEALYHMEPSELILLNLVIVNLYLKDIEKAQEIFNKVDPHKFSDNKLIYYSVGVELYQNLSNLMRMELMLEKAIQHSKNENSKNILKLKLEKLKDQKPK